MWGRGGRGERGEGGGERAGGGGGGPLGLKAEGSREEQRCKDNEVEKGSE